MHRPTYADEQSTIEQQKAMYESVIRAVFSTVDPVYYPLDIIEGIAYQTPNDESWGTILALDYVNCLAMDTGFYDMADFEPVGDYRSDYAIVLSDGKLTHDFRVNR